VSQAERDRLLAWAARRAQGRDSFIASDLAAYQEHHRLDEAQLAAWLDCATQALADLALCRRPSADAPSFRADVERIAVHVGVRAERLARLLRETGAIAALRTAPADPSAPAEHGFLMAARDRQDSHDGDEDQGSP
jgi:hypothetical protein